MAGPGRTLEVGISAREAEVLAALGEHLTNAEIAARMVISIRTVESHVSSLLRKLDAPDRRALAAVAGTVRAGSGTVAAALPAPLTPFVGRVAERAALTAALAEHRLVTAVGPGGVGKTRLALSVAGALAERFADGVWYVDLVPVTDPAMIAPAIADGLGLGERQGSSAVDDVLSWLAGREALLVLDNCEHLLDGVVVLLERLLAGSPRLVVLATSRARLLVPFEQVFPVPGLSVDAAGGDAVELFAGRAAAAGSPVRPEDLPRVAALCRALDGMALAIELAAARAPSLGLDGLERGLADRFRLLTGGPRVDDRHRSLRSTLDWSYALLAPPQQAVLRRVSVFAEEFPAAAAAVLLADWPPVPAGDVPPVPAGDVPPVPAGDVPPVPAGDVPPVPAGDVPAILAGLADQSLLTASAGPGGTRYRALETIRQYGADRLAEAGETAEARSRHLRWCLERAAELGGPARADATAWRTAFDDVADELRSALAWAAGAFPQPGPDPVGSHRPEAYRLAVGLAELTFLRGLPGESQRRYEQAAGLAADDRAAAEAWRAAAGAAEARHVGVEALALRQRAVDAALRAGDRSAAAADLARNAELINRGPGLMSTRPAAGAAAELIAKGRALAGGDPVAEARLLVAEAFDGDETDPATLDAVQRALVLARRVGDPLIKSAALDQLTGIQLARGEVGAAAASALRRTELLAPVPVTATAALEHFDGLLMASDCAVAAGDLAAGRALAERLRDLPFHREEGHLAIARLIVVTVLAGDWAEAADLAERFREGWERAGRVRAGNLSRAAYAAATLSGLRGDDAARAGWLEVVEALRTPGRTFSQLHFGEFFDALLLLHRGRPDEAVRLMATPPEEFTHWYDGMWRQWYAALWAEAAVLAGVPDAADRVRRARAAVAGNPIAAALVERAAALSTPDGDRAGMTAAATALLDAGCRYQWARTLVLLGGADRDRGASALAAMGATATAWPPG